MNDLTLGIDTSNYKTSVAVTDPEGGTVFQRSEFLKVEQGERGLRQSVAFFRHSQVLPLFIEDVFQHVDAENIRTVAVSDRPRNVEGSYMPVFLAGTNAGRILAAALGAEYQTFSHQEGHIAAALSTIPKIESPFLFFHLSGGTTECLLCRRKERGYQVEIVGGTKDISIGQLLDRAGVKLGYSFPAGKYLDQIAGSEPVSVRPGKIKIKDGYFNLSGTETQVLRSIDENGDAVIPGLFERIGALLRDSASDLASRYIIRDVILAGGVAASNTIRLQAESWTEETTGCRIHFGSRELSGDNAVGISLLGGQCNR